MSSTLENTPNLEEDSEDDLDWEEVEVPEHQHLEITLRARPKPNAVNKKKGISHAERLARIDCHKIHTVALLGNAWMRNKWINDPLLHARLLSLTPLSLQTAFGMIHKSRIPDQNYRGRQFEAAITRLVEWWSGTFFEVTLDGHLRNQTFDEVQRNLTTHSLISQDDPNSILDIDALLDTLDDEGDRIRSPKSLMKHALMRSGSRDTSAQLFTALCRGLGIPARLIVSLQSVPWQAGIGKPKPKYEKKTKGKKGKEKAESVAEEDEMEEIDIPETPSTPGSRLDTKDKGKAKVFLGEGQRLDGESSTPKSDKAKGKEKAKPIIRLRKTKSKGHVLGATADLPSGSSSSRLATPDPITTPPVFWTEVFSRADARWLPVDPIRCIVNKRKVFDPSPVSSAAASSAQPGSTIYPHPYAAPTSTKRPRLLKQENRLVYVLGFEEDGYVRDVTRRYARDFGAKVAKVQGGSAGIGGKGKARRQWWERVVGFVSRPYRLHRDDAEDEELEVAQLMEGMPTTISGFKDHPLYVLPRHLKQTETIYPAPPATAELGKFRGEPVYPRSSVVPLKTAENWMRSEGRTVKEGCQAMKFVKVRAGTVNRMRELEVMKDGLKEAGEDTRVMASGDMSGGEVMQGLYARSQTEPYTPEPIIDGKVPKNNFGNIDLYVPSMLPRGAVHVPFKGVAKIARKLGFDFADAVVGFEFKKRRAFPIIEGVVIAAENEPVLLEAYWEAETEAEEKARFKREERAIKRWTRLVQGLRIRQRLQEQYASKPEEEQRQETSVNEAQGGDANQAEVHAGGGFLVEADDVVQAFHLPKYQHVNLPFHTSAPGHSTSDDVKELISDVPDSALYQLETMDVDSDLEEIITAPATNHTAPKTMRELAEDAAWQREREGDLDDDHNDDTEEYRLSPPPAGIVTPVIKVSRPSSPSRTPSSIRIPSATKKRPPATRRAPARKRRRDISETGSDDDREPSPPKKAKARPAATAPVASTRTLRPRTSKTQAQLLEEKEREDAFRRAVAK